MPGSKRWCSCSALVKISTTAAAASSIFLTMLFRGAGAGLAAALGIGAGGLAVGALAAILRRFFAGGALLAVFILVLCFAPVLALFVFALFALAGTFFLAFPDFLAFAADVLRLRLAIVDPPFFQRFSNGSIGGGAPARQSGHAAGAPAK